MDLSRYGVRFGTQGQTLPDVFALEIGDLTVGFSPSLGFSGVGWVRNPRPTPPPRRSQTSQTQTP